MYVVCETTDGKYIGTVIDIEATAVGSSIELCDGFHFQVVNRLLAGDIITLANSNYVIKLRKEGE